MGGWVAVHGPALWFPHGPMPTSCLHPKSWDPTQTQMQEHSTSMWLRDAEGLAEGTA